MKYMKKKVKIANNGKCSVGIFCLTCNVDYELTGLDSVQLERLYNRNETKEKIQDILPDVSAEWRELLISHTCPKCWKKMFG